MSPALTNGVAPVVNGVRKPVPPRGPLITPVYGKLKPQKPPVALPVAPVRAPPAETNGVKKVDAPVTPRAPLRTVSPPLKLEDHPIDQYPSLKAVIVGAGIAGLSTAILLQAKVPGLELVILEKNADVGGVWNTNIHPGASSDEFSDVYQATFAPKTTWSSDYAPSAEIKEYWQSLSGRFGIEKKVRFNHEVVESRWSAEKSKWLLSIRSNGITRTEESDFLITATGIFRDSRLPKIPGIDNYLGHLRHTSDWDPNFDLTGKRVAIIGNDLSGLQLLPRLQKVVKHLDHYQEAPNLIASPADGDADDLRHAPQDPKGYTKYRKTLESIPYAKFATIVHGTEPSKEAKDEFQSFLKSNLKGRDDLQEHFRLDYSRTSGASTGYLQALTQANVNYITTPISRITRKGVQTTDGEHRPVDAIFFATSADSSAYSVAFPIFGPTDLDLEDEDDDPDAPATNLQKKWQPPGYPDTYLGLAAPEYPNLFFVLGANSTGAGSATSYAIETQATYIAKVLRKVRTQGIRTITPSAEATKDFRAYTEAFFPTTVLSDEKNTAWYNGNVPGGRVLAFWPGSSIHAAITRRDPRWEDYSYTYRNQQANRFGYLGNGWSVKDAVAANLGGKAAEKVGFAAYLKEDAVGWRGDLRNLHEDWWEL